MGKAFLCLGAGPGIGMATAMKFAQQGYRVTLAARSRERLERLAAEITEKTGQEAGIVQTDAGDWRRMRELGEALGAVDVVHFNAAIVRGQTLEEAGYASLHEDIAVGVAGALYAIKSFATGMLARKSGTFLLTGGILALNPAPQYLALGVAKAGIRNMTEALFDTFRQDNVHIATVTVGVPVAPRSREASAIADIFWDIHCQTRDQWTWEETYVNG